MKFCYFDESGMGDEPYLVMVGIVVDATRMHVTKDAWSEFLDYLSKAAGRQIEEFHTRDFYRGNGVWRELDGIIRSRIIEAVLGWVEKRKHKCVLSALDKDKYENQRVNDDRLLEMKSKWCATALHCTLQVQKHHQREEKTKGHSVLIFDRELYEEKHLSLLIHKPPSWFDTFYNRDKKQPPLDQIVDVPFFGDSRHILLSQVADLFAYILRTAAEIHDRRIEEKYKDEGEKMKDWSGRIAKFSFPRSSRYPVKGRCPTAQLFWDLAPSLIRDLE